MDITPVPGAPPGATSPNAAAFTETGSVACNLWYDRHVLSGPAGSRQGPLYRLLNTSSSAPLSVDDAEFDVIGSEADPNEFVVPDPPPYEYPPVGRYPTVFFTAVLQGYNHPSGLGPAEQAAFSAVVNAFLAPSPDIIVSNTSVITQAVAGSGLRRVPAQLPGGTLQGDPNLVFPTATWGSVRTVNIKEALPTALATVVYNWKVGDYGDCSKLCGGGVQARRVQCLDNYGNEADTSSCPQATPAHERACQTQPCQASLPTNFTLQLGDWGPCNSTCGYSSRTRSAVCMSQEGYLTSLSSCYASPGELWQDMWQPCAQPECPTYYWSYSDWACNNTLGCGGGEANRTATCVQAGSSKRYVQRRMFDCVNMTTNAVVPHIWCSGPKPELGDVECPGPENCTAATAPLTPMTEDTPVGGGTSTSSNAAAGPSSQLECPDAGVGPGQGLPEWLLKDPTPLLKSLMDCPSSYAVSVNGKCCGGSQLDSKGVCCDGGVVDACGVCNGTGRAIDALGACCTGTLDAQGVCCTSTIDECGVCNGKNACDLRADLVATLPSAALYLIPNSSANRRLRSAGRAFDKMRLSIVLSGYVPPGAQPAAPAKGSASLSQFKSGDFFPQQLNSDAQGQPAEGNSSSDSAADGSKAAVSTKLTDSSAAAPTSLAAGRFSNSIVQPVQGQQPVQLDTLPTEEQQQAVGLPVLQASMLHVANQSEAAAVAATMGGIKLLVNGVASSSNITGQAPGTSQISRSSGSAAAGSAALTVTSSNSMTIGVVMHSGAAATGPDTGIVLLAVHHMLGSPMPVPGSSSKLTVREVVSVVRSGTCGDGVCQQLPGDCALPFLSCPAVNGSQAPCNARGVCFNSLGSCSCTTGYTGTDCSSCALNYKSINGFCLSSNLTTSSSLLAQLSRHRSMAGGQAAVTAVVVGSMLVVAGAAWVVWRRRTKCLMRDYEEQLKSQVESYFAP
ncbi:hypothetical protein COO60DRAFT_1644127 [Scenedesmus sp. NREL 46B-D3]|nr:hypothetical protein COO60DRAFT_1644127 [Scenedesmus sp. NREL 46B-D3]